MSDYLTAKEAAEIIGTTEDYVTRQCKAKVIKGKKLGNTWRIARVHLDAFMLDEAPAPATRIRLTARQQRKSA